ncbi:MAG TPA: LacI family DNA-binding transcriptional regulator [Candidatus Eisenbacteria bacterium]|nr:LacI family DNA-binding transcriptional regulator [Candidatus Eisenbacteria bacterium]
MKGKRSGIPLIAELAGVSIGTVDRALHGRPGINEDTRVRVLAVAKKIGYRPNLAARSLSTGKRIRIGVCVPREIRYFYNEMWTGIHEEIERYSNRGIDFLLEAVPELGKGERPAFRRLLDSGVQGIVVTPGNPEAMTPLIDAAEESGARVVCVSTDAPESRRSCIVCVEPRLNGLIAGELMSKFVPPASAVAVITGMLKTVDHREKTGGFTKSFTEYCRGGSVAAVIEGHEDPDESFRKTRKLLKRMPELAGIYINTVNCLPVCRALSATTRASRVRIIATDLFREMVPLFRSGTIDASMHQRPFRQGQIAVRALAEHLLHDAELPKTHYLNPGIILRSNLQLFRETGGRGA